MSWAYWNKKLKNVFIIIVVFLIIILIFSSPQLKDNGPVTGIRRIAGLLLGLGITGIVGLFKNDYKKESHHGNCVKCNKSCEYI